MIYTATTGNTIDLIQNHDSVFSNNNTANDININIKFTITTEYPSNNYQSSPCDYCSNNPKNGGSGVCYCTLVLPRVTC